MAFNETDTYIPGDAGGACYFCRADQRELFPGGRRERIWRCDVDIEFEGFLCICETCAGELAGLLGWLSPAQADAISQKLTEARTERNTLRRRIDAADEAVAAMRTYEEATVDAG